MQSQSLSRSVSAALVLLIALPAAARQGAGEDAGKTCRLLDLDGQGGLDLLRIGSDGTLTVSLNVGGRRFQDVPQELPRALVRDVLSSDLDGDGRMDLYLVSTQGDVALLGEGGGRFREATVELGLGEDGDGRSAERLDLDGDGLEDLVVHETGGDLLFWARSEGGFERDPQTLVPMVAGPVVVPGSPLEPVAGAPTAAPTGAGAPGAPSRTDAGPPARPKGSRVPATAAPAPTSSPEPLMGISFDGRYVNDDQGEVDGADIVDGTLTGGDVSTSSGDVTFTGATVRADRLAIGYASLASGGHSTVSGGAGNTASGSRATVSGGDQNEASGDQSTVAGGDSNAASGTGAFVGSGLANLALSDRAAIAGGVGNRASYRAFVGGGDTNAALGNLATIAGGKQNDALQTGAFVGGGEQNTADAAHASVAGGFGNAATGKHAAIGGGLSNLATAAYGTIPGGRQNTAAGAYSLAAGRRAKALHDGAFVWADSEDADLASTGPDQFVVRAAGGMGVGKVPDPSFQLDVDGAVRASDTIVSTKPLGAPLSVASSDLNANLNADYLDGLHASAFSQFGVAVDTNELADDAVTGAKIASGAVGSDELAAGAVTATALASDSVGVAALAPDSVGASEIASQAVGSDEVADGSLTEADVSFGSLSVAGEIESTSGGIRFPDGSLQTTATAGSGLPTGSMILRPSNNAPSGFTWTGLRVNATREGSGWQALLPAPGPVSDHASAGARVGGALGDWHLFVVGGADGSGNEVASVRAYDVAAASWSTLPAMPLGPRTDLALIGDRNGPSYHLLAVGGSDGGQELARVERYDVDAQTWTTRSPMPTERFGMAAVVRGEVYVIGGETTAGPGGVLDTVEAYDDTGDSWTSLAPMPTPRSQLALVLVDERIYAIGGRNQAGSAVDVVEIYDIPSDTWSTTFPLPEPRTDAAAVLLGGSIYVIGGETDAGSPHADAFELVPGAASSWSSSPGLALTPARSGHTLLEFGDAVYSIGGRTPTTTDLFEVAASPSEWLYVHQKD